MTGTSLSLLTAWTLRGDIMPPEQQLLDKLTRLDELMVANLQEKQKTNELLSSIAQAGGVQVDSDARPQYVQANPASSLSMRGGWSYDMVDISERSVAPGGTVSVNNEGERGFLLTAAATVQGEYGGLTEVKFKTDDYNINTTIRERFLAGVVSAGSSYLPFVPVFNADDDIYTVAFANINGYHFKKNLNVSVTTPAQAQEDFEVGISAVQVIIDDMDEFMRVDYGT